ncbi:MAG: response regulator [Pirellulaceae bacterium]|jgi:DNA-binding response OmpR family regulator|nr:response regulator [Pirellulaceae bacterium]
MRVLVVDDSVVMRGIVVRILRMMGVLRVIEAGDGQDGWAAYELNRPNLVITDWHMPLSDGLELTKRIRRVDPHVPIVMLTVVDSKACVIEAVRAGVNDYVCKPFGRDELQHKLDRFIPVQ